MDMPDIAIYIWWHKDTQQHLMNIADRNSLPQNLYSMVYYLLIYSEYKGIWNLDGHPACYTVLHICWHINIKGVCASTNQNKSLHHLVFGPARSNILYGNRSFRTQVISYPSHFVPFWSFRTHFYFPFGHFVPSLVISYPFHTQFGHFVPTFIIF